MGFNFTKQVMREEKTLNEEEVLVQKLMNEGTQLSEDEQNFFLILKNDMPPLEEVNAFCDASFESLFPEIVPFAGRSPTDNEIDAYTKSLIDLFVLMFEQPTPLYMHVEDFILLNEPSDPRLFFDLLKGRAKLCINRDAIQMLRTAIDASSENNWSAYARYQLSKIVEPLLFVFQSIPSPDRLLLYINVVEALEQKGLIIYNGHLTFQDFKTRIEDIYLSINDDLANETLSVEVRNNSLRRYLKDLKMLAEELTEVVIQDSRSIMPEESM